MKVMTGGKPPVITFFASLRQIDRYKIYYSYCNFCSLRAIMKWNIPLRNAAGHNIRTGGSSL